MALVYVGGNTGTWAGATAGNNNVSLTALTGGIAAAAAAGDFVVAVYATGSAADRTLVIQDPSAVAYTLIDVERYANGTTYDSNLRVAFKRLTAADANVVFGPTGNAQDAGAAAIHVWRGVNTATPQDVTAVGTSGTGTGRPNPPAITPTTAGAVVIATGGAAAATGAVFVGTGLSNFRTATSVDTNDGMVGIGSFAWTSGAYDPAAWTGGTANAADSWTSITLVLRPGATQTLTPTLFTNTQTFFSPDVTQSGAAQTLTPSLYTNTQTFHNPTVSATYGLTPALYTNDQAFFSADVTQAGGAQALTPSLYTNTQTFFSPTAAATYALTPALYSNGQTFFSPTVTATRTLTPALYTNTQSFFAPTVTASKTLTAALFTNTQSFFAPTVTATYSLTPAKYDNNQTFYAATATASYTIAPDLAVNAQTFYAPTVTQAAPGQTLAPDLYTNTQAFYSPTVAPGAVTLLPQGYVDDGYVSPGYVGPNTFSTQAFFAPAVTTSKTLTPSLLTNASSFYAPTVALESYLITKAQALSLYKVWLLQGLAPQALTVAPSSRSAGGVSQSITQVDDTVTVSTTASPTAVGADPGTMIDEIALLHGLGSDLVVTPLARSAGAISQTLATTGSTTTVTRV